MIGLQESCTLRELNVGDPNGAAHVVKLINTFVFDGIHFCLVLELLHTTLLGKIQTIYPQSSVSIDEIRKLAFQLVTCLAFLEHSNIIHADLKPENIISTSGSSLVKSTGKMKLGHFKVVDFGNAMKKEHRFSYFEEFELQSLLYRAPEILFGLNSFDNKIDIWSLGCILVEVFIGTPLFAASYTSETLVHSMLKQLGPIPPKPFVGSKFYYDYFSKNHTLLVKIEDNVQTYLWYFYL
jgi:serine/threonine protein kinase